MRNYFKELSKDIDDIDLPENLDNYLKINETLTIISGKRIYWYYKEDLECFQDMGEYIKDFASDLFSGICIPRPSIEYNGGELDVEDCIIVSDRQPTEKSYPEVEWISMKRLLNDNDLIEIFEKN